MAATAEQKREFANELKKFRGDIDSITKEISLMKKVITESPNLKGYVQIGTAMEHLKITGNYLAISDISNEILTLKNETYLNNARKEIYKVLQVLEELVSNEMDTTLNENQDILQRIKLVSVKQKLNLLKALKESIQGTIDRFGPNTKWRWSFQELHARTAVIGKNITDWRQVERNRDPRHPEYQTINLLAKFVKDELFFSAQEFKRKFELSDTKIEGDLKQIIRLFEALKKIHSHFGEVDSAEKIQTLMEATKETMENLIAEKEGKKKPKAEGPEKGDKAKKKKK